MEIKFLGTGGSGDYTKGTSSAVVKREDKTFLIDCGSTVYAQLRTHNMAEEIDYILITHLHGDHVGCLFQYIYYVGAVHKKLTTFIYSSDAFKQSIIDFLDMQEVPNEYYDFVHIDDIEGLDYIDTTGMHTKQIPGHSYYFTDENELMYYSGDIGNTDVATEFLNTRTEEKITVFHEINARDLESHVYYKDAMEKLSDYTAYGYHCDKATMPEDNTFPLVEDYPELNYGF